MPDEPPPPPSLYVSPIPHSPLHPPCSARPSTTEDSFDLYYGLYKYNPMARTQLDRLEASFATIRSRLDECEAAEAVAAAKGAAAAQRDAAPPVADAPPPPASACNGGATADAAAAATAADTPAEGAPAKEVVGAAI